MRWVSEFEYIIVAKFRGLLKSISRVAIWRRRVTLCRDARSERPSPLKETISILVLPFYNGRTDRASLQDVVTARASVVSKVTASVVSKLYE